MHIMLPIFKLHLYQMMMLFQKLDSLCIEDLDLHNLAVKKASSLLLMPLSIFIKLLAKLYMLDHYCIKSKRFCCHN
jgi:hypothetical protein